METPWKNHGTANWMEVYSLYIDVYSRKSWKKQEQIREIHAKWRFVKYLDLGPWGLNFCGIRHKIEVNSWRYLFSIIFNSTTTAIRIFDTPRFLGLQWWDILVPMFCIFHQNLVSLRLWCQKMFRHICTARGLQCSKSVHGGSHPVLPVGVLPGAVLFLWPQTSYEDHWTMAVS